MMADHGEPLWAIYAAIPQPSRDAVRRWVLAMAEGMAGLDDADRAPRFVDRDGVQVLRDESDYDSYCYFVAGTVGHMSTDLLIEHYGVGSDTA